MHRQCTETIAQTGVKFRVETLEAIFLGLADVPARSPLQP
jgi:hypothetical protein